MLVHVVDPAAYTPPYDHALSAALARAGAQVELITSRFPHGPVPRPEAAVPSGVPLLPVVEFHQGVVPPLDGSGPLHPAAVEEPLDGEGDTGALLLGQGE